MGDSEIEVSPELEVQKLQQLVRKLERQNEILRNKQAHRESTGSRGSSLSEESKPSDKNRITLPGGDSVLSKAATTATSFDDIHLIDVGRISDKSDEEDSW